MKMNFIIIAVGIILCRDCFGNTHSRIVKMLDDHLLNCCCPSEQNSEIEKISQPEINISINMLVSQGVGLYRLDRDGYILWSHFDPKCSHDADLLGNGIIIYVFGMHDNKSDTTVKVIRPDGTLVWSWRAFDYFHYPPFSDIDPAQG